MRNPLEIQKFLRRDGTMSDLKSDPYNLKINTDSEGRRIVFKYNQIKSDLSLDIVQEARGLILDRKNDWEVVSFPFPKFFNYGESFAVDIDWKTAQVFEKLDGTCSVLYYFDGEWVMHTLGTVEGEGPVHVDDLLSIPFDGTFFDLFFYTWNEVYGEEKLEELNEDFVYVFELMTPYNIVVKEHKEYKLSLLAVRDLNTLDEIPLSNFEDRFYTPERFSFDDLSVETLEESLEKLPPDEEGYVVCDANFKRIKLKNPAYVVRHKMKDSAINKKNGVLEIVLDERDDDFVSTFPDLKEDVDDIKKKINTVIDYLDKMFGEFEGSSVNPDDSQERKEFALKVKDQIPQTLRGYMFEKMTSGRNFEDIIKDSRVDKVAQSIRAVQNL